MSATILFVGLCLFAPADAPQDAIKKDMAQIDGEWIMVSGLSDGVPMPEAKVKTGRRSAKNGETTVMLDGKVFMKAKFTIDPTKKPKAIDYEVTEGPTKGSTRLGIYELDGDTLKFNFAVPYKDRPEDFKANPGSKQTVSVWKRAPKDDKEKK